VISREAPAPIEGPPFSHVSRLHLDNSPFPILLCSRHSLSSDYVVDKEIAIIREWQAKGEHVHSTYELELPS
jgi:hypothetical protein